MKTIYTADGNVYRVCYDYHDKEGITDYELISDYQSLSEKNSND